MVTLKEFFWVIQASFFLAAFLLGDYAHARQDTPSPVDLQQIDEYLGQFYPSSAVATEVIDKHGRRISCVERTKQPALRHPLLANHQIQIRPSAELAQLLGNRVRDDTTSSDCPNGLLEMRLPAREDMIQAGSLKRFLDKRGRRSDATTEQPPTLGSNPTHEYAAAKMFANMIGAQSTINIWRPNVFRTDFSLTQLWVYAGQQTAEAGSNIYPLKYGTFFFPNNDPHFFIYFTADGYQSTGCYNLDCPGFVQTSNILSIGGVLSTSSIGGGTQTDGSVAYYRDPTTGNWILFFFDGKNYIQSGYYPKAIYGTGPMSLYAQGFDVGGEILDYNGGSPFHTTTDMGSGQFSASGYSQAAYHKNVQYMGTDLVVRPFQQAFLLVSKPGCYDILRGSDPSWGYSIFFGGPGNSPTCP